MAGDDVIGMDSATIRRPDPRTGAPLSTLRCADPAAPEDLGWGRLLSEVRVVPVPGTHHRLFSDHSRELAAIVGTELTSEVILARR